MALEEYSVFMKKKIIAALLVIGGAALGSIVTYKAAAVLPFNVEAQDYYYENPLFGTSDITCKFDRIMSATYIDGSFKSTFTKKQGNPIVSNFIFEEGSDFGKLRYIDATETINEVDIVKLAETPETIYVINTNSDTYLETYTIFKKRGFSIYTKGANISLFNYPSGSLSIGPCTGY